MASSTSLRKLKLNNMSIKRSDLKKGSLELVTKLPNKEGKYHIINRKNKCKMWVTIIEE